MGGFTDNGDLPFPHPVVECPICPSSDPPGALGHAISAGSGALLKLDFDGQLWILARPTGPINLMGMPEIQICACGAYDEPLTQKLMSTTLQDNRSLKYQYPAVGILCKRIIE